VQVHGGGNCTILRQRRPRGADSCLCKRRGNMVFFCRTQGIRREQR
jgi:hypothetical protein